MLARGRRCRGPRGEAERRKPEMNEHGKSDGSVVPSKPPNKDELRGQRSDGEPYTGTKVETPETAKGGPKAQRGQAAPTAEAVEGRDPANGNSSPQNTNRTLSRGHAQCAGAGTSGSKSG